MLIGAIRGRLVGSRGGVQFTLGLGRGGLSISGVDGH